jgi:hypothetical protein
MSARPIRPLVAVAVALILAAASAACGGGDKKAGTTSPLATGKPDKNPDELMTQTASYDVATGPANRFAVGVFNPSRGPLGYGTVDFTFSFLGETQATGTPRPGPAAIAHYLPLPGSPPPTAAAGNAPMFLPTDQRGVYAADVAFDQAGFWQVKVTADLGGSKASATTAFKVLPHHDVPARGDPAIPSENLTVSTPGAPPEAIDSRASATVPVPDPELHQTTVAQALREKRPVVLVISTPTYCVSLFCGPVTEMAAELSKEYANRARFIHIEVFKNYQGQVLNDAAKEWIARRQDQDINEPWVFLIGADGKIVSRLDNVATRGEIEPWLRQLPVQKS